MEFKQLSNEEKIDWIRLINSQKIGPITFYRLIKKYGSASKALEQLPTISKNPDIKIPTIDFAKEELEKASKQNIHIIAYCENEYPIHLRNINDAPPIIYAKGNLHTLQNDKTIAIVGTRNASLNAKNFSGKLAKNLTDNNITIVSGMAIGIDTFAHKGSLASLTNINTKTIAVLGGGVDDIYPPQNKSLYEEILLNGCIISENPIGSKPTPSSFPKRNRIISGLSLGTIVVEALIKSGSMITAKNAQQQGRTVMAVPNFPTDPRSQGVNKLIKEGAKLIQNHDDVLEVIKHISENQNEFHNKDLFSGLKENIDEFINDNYDLENPQSKEELKQSILNSLSTTPISIEQLISEHKVSVSNLSQILLELELEEKISYSSGNKIFLINS